MSNIVLHFFLTVTHERIVDLRNPFFSIFFWWLVYVWFLKKNFSFKEREICWVIVLSNRKFPQELRMIFEKKCDDFNFFLFRLLHVLHHFGKSSEKWNSFTNHLLYDCRFSTFTLTVLTWLSFISSLDDVDESLKKNKWWRKNGRVWVLRWCDCFHLVCLVLHQSDDKHNNGVM